jgi:hypothetical protein
MRVGRFSHTPPESLSPKILYFYASGYGERIRFIINILIPYRNPILFLKWGTLRVRGDILGPQNCVRKFYDTKSGTFIILFPILRWSFLGHILV